MISRATGIMRQSTCRSPRAALARRQRRSAEVDRRMLRQEGLVAGGLGLAGIAGQLDVLIVSDVVLFQGRQRDRSGIMSAGKLDERRHAAVDRRMGGKEI